MIKRKKLFKIILIVLGFCLFVGCSSGNSNSAINKKIIRISNGQPEDHPDNIALRAFKEHLEGELGDKYEVQIYANELLGSSKNALELCQTGALEMVIASASNMETFDSVYSIFSLPYLFNGVESYYETMGNSEITDLIYNTTIDQGVITIGWFDAGTRNFYGSKPLEKVEDIVGMKIRVQPSPTNVAMMDAFDAGAVPMSFSEVYTALQNGTIDGAENNELALTTVKHGEVAKFYSYNMHQIVPDLIIANYNFIDSLEGRDKEVFFEALDIAEKIEQEEWVKQTQEAIDYAENVMGVTFIEADVNSFREKVLPLHERVVSENENLRPIYEAIDAINDKHAEEAVN